MTMWFHKFELLEKAARFARSAHQDQKRKYSGEPYFNHCAEVADLLIEYAHPTVEAVAAALLHDVVEDCPITNDEIAAHFGDEVALYVSEVTDVSKPGDGNRMVRKAIDRQHLAKAGYWGQSIKYADLTANTRDITKQDPDFARVYLKEKMLLLEAMRGGNPTMRQVAVDTLKEGWQQIYKEDLVIA